jgi:hypothetical protein
LYAKEIVTQAKEGNCSHVKERERRRIKCGKDKVLG